MKRTVAIILMCLLLVCCTESSEIADAVPPDMQQSSSQENESSSDSVHDTRQENAVLKEPILVTSLGQNTGVLLVREMFNDLDVAFTCELMAEPESVSGYGTVVLAVGASSKALGANGISISEEYNRSKQFLADIPDETTVVMIRIGNYHDKDEWTDKFVSLALPCSDIIITTENGDKNNELRDYADKNSIKYYSSKTARDMNKLLGELV